MWGESAQNILAVMLFENYSTFVESRLLQNVLTYSLHVQEEFLLCMEKYKWNSF